MTRVTLLGWPVVRLLSMVSLRLLPRSCEGNRVRKYTVAAANGTKRSSPQTGFRAKCFPHTHFLRWCPSTKRRQPGQESFSFSHFCSQSWNAKKCWELWLHTLHILHSETPRNRRGRTESYCWDGSWTDTVLRRCGARLRTVRAETKGSQILSGRVYLPGICGRPRLTFLIHSFFIFYLPESLNQILTGKKNHQHTHKAVIRRPSYRPWQVWTCLLSDRETKLQCSGAKTVSPFSACQQSSRPESVCTWQVGFVKVFLTSCE